MIHPEIQEVASVFRGELHWMFGPYPDLIPDGGWPSIGVLDALCTGLQGRSDLRPGERLFLSGAAAHLGEVIETCWNRFAPEVRIEHGDGVICSARFPYGEFYTLSLERLLVAALQDPGSLRLPDRHLPFHAAAGRNPVELLGLTACLGISPHGQGEGSELSAEALATRAEQVIPVLAESCAEHYARRHPDEWLGQRGDLYGGLLWPLTLCDGALALEEAGAILLGYLDGSSAEMTGALPLLRNLTRFPSSSVRSAAMLCLMLDERTAVTAELAERIADHTRGRETAFRTATIALAAGRGRKIDWLRGGANAAARFGFERSLSLLPLVHLPFELCVDPRNRELVEALVRKEAKTAGVLIERRLAEGSRDAPLLFQQAALKLELGEAQEAEGLLSEVVRKHPEAVDARFYLKAGEVALANNDLDDAQVRLLRAKSLGARPQDVGRLLGRAYLSAGRLEDALTILMDYGSRGEPTASLLVHRAEIHRELGHQEGYFRDLAAAASTQPFHPGVVERVLAGFVNA